MRVAALLEQCLCCAVCCPAALLEPSPTRRPQAAPEEPTPAGMSCRLLPYQRKALAWMAAVETGWFGASLGVQLHPLWMELCVDVTGR